MPLLRLSCQGKKKASWRVPFRLRVGVTGHREIANEDEVAGQVRKALARIRELVPATKETQVHLTVVSPLAEGADRIVAREALKEEGTYLEVPLPFAAERYIKDFQTEESRREFHELLSQAREVVVVEQMEDRDHAYESVGQYTVDRCDVLIALWDGRDTGLRGGTGEIVRYARGGLDGQAKIGQTNRLGRLIVWLREMLVPSAHGTGRRRRVPLLWINTEGPLKLTEEPGDGVEKIGLRELDAFNSAGVLLVRESALDLEGRSQDGRRVDTSLPLDSIADWVAPFYARADRLATWNQLWYTWLGAAVFVLAASAVTAAASQALFAPGKPEYVWIEVGLLALLLMIVAAGRWFQLHERWISYRFLAERFRSAAFLVLAGLKERRQGGLQRARLGHASEDWIRRAFAEVWKRRPESNISEADVVALRTVLAERWIGDQAGYHRKAGGRHHFRHHLLTRVSATLFILTGIIAALHASSAIGRETEGSIGVATILLLLATGLPAFGGAVSGIRTQGEYHRNAERFGNMAEDLERTKERMESASDLDTIRAVAVDAEEVMLQENRDWFVMMKFHDFELHV